MSSRYGSKNTNKTINELGYNAPPPQAVRDIVAAGGSSGVTSKGSGPSYKQTASGNARAETARKTNTSISRSSPAIYMTRTASNKAGPVITVNDNGLVKNQTALDFARNKASAAKSAFEIKRDAHVKATAIIEASARSILSTHGRTNAIKKRTGTKSINYQFTTTHYV